MTTPEGMPPLDYIPTEGWRDDAKCKGTDPTLWFPTNGVNNSREVKAICAGCPVQLDCLTTALDEGEIHGFVGGYGVQERRRMRPLWPRRACRFCRKPQPYSTATGGSLPTCAKCAASRTFQLLEEGRQVQLRHRLKRGVA